MLRHALKEWAVICQALAQGLELARRGHVGHVVTKDIPGYPVIDEDYHGVFIHRWVKTRSAGPCIRCSRGGRSATTLCRMAPGRSSI